MPSSYLIFDFGEDEQNAQQARHKVEGWKQGFRLGDKLAFKFEREQGDPDEDEDGDGKDLAAASKEQGGEGGRKGPVFVQTKFSDHEKLSLQRWLDRIPTEEPFKSADSKIVRHNDPDFATIDQLFETLG